MNRVFKKLASIELGRSPVWDGPMSFQDLDRRIRILAGIGSEECDVTPPALIDALDQDDSHGGSLDLQEIDRIKKRFFRSSTPSEIQIQPPGLQVPRLQVPRARMVGSQLDDKLGGDEVNHSNPIKSPDQLEYYLEKLRLDARRKTSLFITPSGLIETTVDWASQMAFHEIPVTSIFARFTASEPEFPSSCDSSPRIDVTTMMARMNTRKLITGAPGVGKTRLLDWIGESIARDAFSGIRVPLVVDAARFAERLEQTPAMTLAEFALRSVCSSDLEAKVNAHRLRDRCHEDPEAILLIDNWGAVPLRLQSQVHRALLTEEQHFNSIIAMRDLSLELLSIPGRGKASLFEMDDASTDRGRAPSPNQDRYWNQLISHAYADRETDARDQEAFACEQAIAWEVQRSQNAPPDGRLDFAHLKILSQLAFETLPNQDAREGATYRKIRRHRIEELTWKNQIELTPILQSRILRRSQMPSDQYVFLNDRIRFYLAAVYLTEQLSEEHQVQFLRGGLFERQKFAVLKNAVPLSESFRQALRQNISQLIKQDDLFHLVLTRLTELTTIANWSTWDLESPAHELRERAWFAIRERERSLGIHSNDLLHALAVLDPEYLRRRAFNDLDHELPLFALVIEVLGKQPRQPSQTLRPLQTYSGESISISDQLKYLRRIAALPPTHPEVCDSLAVLARSNQGLEQSLLISLVHDESLNDSTRQLAIEAIGTCCNASIEQSIVSLHVATTSHKIRLATIKLACRQPICLSLSQLESEIFQGDADTSAWGDALEACLVSYPVRSKAEQSRIRLIFLTLLSDTLQPSTADHFCSLWEKFENSKLKWPRQRTRSSGWDPMEWIDGKLQQNAASILNGFIQQPCQANLRVVQNATLVLRYSFYEQHHVHLRDAVATVVRERMQQSSARRQEQLDSILYSLLATIANIKPEILLSIQLESTWVEAATERVMDERGWFFYHDRIIDQQMRTVASRGSDSFDLHPTSTPEIVQQIIEELPPRQRNDFLSYWHIISESNEDYVHTDRETVHKAICMVMKSDTNTLLSERLFACYRDGAPPSFGSWKKNLARVVNRCDKHPEWIAHLERIGLTSSRRRPR